MEGTEQTGQERSNNIRVVQVSDYLIWSIINMIVFSWTFGIIPSVMSSVALVFSILTRNANKTESFTEAQHHSRIARIFNILATVLGILYVFLTIYLFVFKHSIYLFVI
jgi:hypothetical protein